MKKFQFITKATMIAMVLVAGVSCTDNDDAIVAPIQQQTIAQIATGNPDLSSLVAALDRANLVTTLDGAGQFTVFAPSNAAFATFLQQNGFANLEAVPVPLLREVLLNHVISGKNLSTQLSTGYVKTLGKGSASATNTLSMFLNTSSGVVINGGIANGGATVTTADIAASNGVIHLVNGVIKMPTVVNHAIANPNFSSLVSALTRADQPDFVGILSGDGPFTVFAPTNDAFASLLTELNLSGLTDVPQATLENVLKYHVVAGANVLSTMLTNNMVVTTFQTGTFTIQTSSSGATITDANMRMSNIIAVDVQASNGVVHAIDTVLLP